MASKKYASVQRKVYRPAIERGIPAKIVDAIVDAGLADVIKTVEKAA